MEHNDRVHEDSAEELTRTLPINPLRMKILLQEAVDYLAEVFECDEAVDGANVVEWFSEWRRRALLALSTNIGRDGEI